MCAHPFIDPKVVLVFPFVGIELPQSPLFPLLLRARCAYEKVELLVTIQLLFYPPALAFSIPPPLPRPYHQHRPPPSSPLDSTSRQSLCRHSSLLRPLNEG